MFELLVQQKQTDIFGKFMKITYKNNSTHPNFLPEVNKLSRTFTIRHECTVYNMDITAGRLAKHMCADCKTTPGLS